MKNMKKIIYIVLAVMMIVAALPGMGAEAASLRIKDKSYGYYNRKLKSNVATIEVNGLKKDQRITKGTVKSSNVSVGKVMGYTRRSYSSSTAAVDSKSKKSSTSSYSYIIRINVRAVGTTDITYEIDGTTYTTTLIINEYANPIEKMTITGLNSGNDLAANIDFSKGYGKVSYSSYAAKKVKFKITPITGWRVVRMAFENESTGYEYSKVNYSTTKKLKSISIGTVKATYDYNISATLVDDYGNSMKVQIKLAAPASTNIK